MKQQQRRVFLKVLAFSPLVGCGPDPSAPHDLGGGAGAAAGGAAGTGSGPPVSGAGNPSFGGGGNASFGGGGNASLGGNPSFNGGTNAGGSPVTTGGQSGANAGGGASAAGTGGVHDPNNPETPIGNVSAFPLGSFSIAGTIFFVAHDAGGLYAMSMQCTHVFCAVDIKGNELDCPCHGSRFDRLGNVLQGPAKVPLPHYLLTVDATGNITVDKYTVVSQSTRTKV